MIEKIMSIKIIRELLVTNKHLIIPLVAKISLKTLKGEKGIKDGRETVIIVSHEASRTGAPILALNICKQLSKKYNIISMVMKNGEILDDFKKQSSFVLLPRYNFVSQKTVKSALTKILGKRKPLYGIVNSAVAAQAIRPLKKFNIPVITLIHEFGAYIKPVTRLDEINMWSNYIVFSSMLTKNDAIERSPVINNSFTRVLPQGKCELPESRVDKNIDSIKRSDSLEKALATMGDKLLIIGAGQVQPRKGIDLFISTASIIKKKCPDIQIEFIWIGAGYDPENDFTISLWLEDQIKRSGLRDCLHILENSPSYISAIKRANIFLMTSRLDPLPNVGIDAMLEEVPIICFEKATGIAEILSEEEILQNSLVADYLDTNDMAEKALLLIKNRKLYEQVAIKVHEKARSSFNMEAYVDELDTMGKESSVQEKQLTKDYYFLKRNRKSKELKEFTINHNNDDQIIEYLLKWKKDIWPRKPVKGFHPGIYKENRMNIKTDKDPFVDYLRSGLPEGLWRKNLIIAKKNQKKNERMLAIGVHIHVHYPELLKEILIALSFNATKPDIFISVNNEAHIEVVEKNIEELGMHPKDIALVPNRGRDIGPLITYFGKRLESEYEIYGHIHTKRSVMIEKELADSWRKYLIANLLGTKEIMMVDTIANAFACERELGIVFPDDPTCVGWTNNLETAEQIGSNMGITKLPKSHNFPVGSMFWARRGALSDLYDLGLGWEDYPIEPLKYDGTILHAIERLLPLIAEKNGYNYKMTYIPGVNR
tara:strand:- start:9731 stop:12034 length:2304 start_codon:yes stop_codon:yes gene_type:complete